MDDTSRRVEGTGRAVAEDTDPGVQRRTTEIREEIEQTREDLSETIDAIQEKLRPRNIVANATEQLKSATTEKVRAMTDTAGETAHDMMDHTRDAAGGIMGAVREHPIPAALIGVGAAWLLMNRQQKRQPTRRYVSTPRPYGYDYVDEENDSYSAFDSDDRGTGFMGRIRSNPVPAALAGVGLGWLALSQSGDRGRGRGDDYYYDADERYRTSTTGRSGAGVTAGGVSAGGVTAGRADAGTGLSDAVARVSSRTGEYAEDATRSVRQTGRRASNGLQRMMRENPLLVGAGALVLGAAFGLAVPETERENELMGEARDTVIERAQEMARNAASQVQNAAGQMAGDVVSKVVTGKTE